MELLSDEGWIYETMGGRLASEGATFRVLAPNAKTLFVLGDFNDWQEEPLVKEGVFWVGTNLRAQPGDTYCFMIDGVRKADPFALAHALRPERASRLIPLPKRRHQLPHLPWETAPINIYEVHLGSWKRRESGEFLSYRELADQLADYCVEMGFTHVELLPLNEHPLDQSWGYQVTGYYAITSRYGLLEDFIALVDRLHEANIGVIIDWVPSHFPKDPFGLSAFDGTALFEGGEQIKWGTFKFDYASPLVRSFLIGSALFWFQVCGVDGIRLDALSSILYQDFADKPQGWEIEDPDGIAFIKELNQACRTHCPGALLIAEDASLYAGITKSLEEGGLGFDLKWNLGWTNDLLDYFAAHLPERKKLYNHLTFGMTYAFDERHVLTLSHDEFGRKSRNVHAIFPEKDRGRQLLLFYCYAMTQPGKKLFFMGSEIGELELWQVESALRWSRRETHVHKTIRALNHLYLKHPALWERDFSWEGFEWIECDDCEKGVLIFKRISSSETLVCVHNFSDQHHANYPIDGDFEVLFNTESLAFGGLGLGGLGQKGELDLPPFSTLLLRPLAIL